LNPVQFGRTKHICIRYYFCRNLVETGEIKVVQYIRSCENASDILSKSQSEEVLCYLSKKFMSKLSQKREREMDGDRYPGEDRTRKQARRNHRGREKH
jgi:hypothetical protein